MNRNISRTNNTTLYHFKRYISIKGYMMIYCITLDSEIIDEIKILAEEDDRSFSQYINLVLKEYLKERMKNKAK